MSNRNYPDLFTAGPKFQMNACVNFMHDMSNVYIEGYRRAADCLVLHVANLARDQDTFVYPIAYMYRQHVELLLKQVINIGLELHGGPARCPTHHDLKSLWGMAKGLMRKSWPKSADPDEFDSAENFITQFTAIDENSTAFRYAYQKDGERSLKDLRNIDLACLEECVRSFSGFLSGAVDGMSSQLDYKREMQQYS